MKKYYVALCTKASAIEFNPTIVDSFKNGGDAEAYAKIMARNKGRKYVVLEAIEEIKPEDEDR